MDDTQAMPDFRVVSVVHDGDNDRLIVSHDDDLDAFHALGLLVAGAFRMLIQVSDFPDLEDLIESDDEED